MSPPLEEVHDAVRRAAVHILGKRMVQDVHLSEAEGFLGEGILRARIVLPRRRPRVSGDTLFEALHGIAGAVAETGETRRVVLEYADPAELEAVGGHQS